MVSEQQRHLLKGLVGMIVVAVGLVYVVGIPTSGDRASSRGPLSEEQIRQVTARLSEAFPGRLSHLESPPGATRIDGAWGDLGEFALSGPAAFERIEGELENGATVHLFSWGHPARRLQIFSDRRATGGAAASEGDELVAEPPPPAGPFAQETRPGVAIGEVWLTFGTPVPEQWQALGLKRVTHFGNGYGEGSVRLAGVQVDITVFLRGGVGNELHISPSDEDAPEWKAVIRGLEVGTQSWWGTPEVEPVWSAGQCDTPVMHYTRGGHEMSLTDSPPGCETGLRYTLENPEPQTR